MITTLEKINLEYEISRLLSHEETETLGHIKEINWSNIGVEIGVLIG